MTNEQQSGAGWVSLVSYLMYDCQSFVTGCRPRSVHRSSRWSSRNLRWDARYVLMTKASRGVRRATFVIKLVSRPPTTLVKPNLGANNRGPLHPVATHGQAVDAENYESMHRNFDAHRLGLVAQPTDSGCVVVQGKLVAILTVSAGRR